MSRSSWIAFSGVLACILGLASVPLAAGEGGRAPRDERAVRRGAVLYELYCQTCHGEDARGDGPLAEHLKVQPANLRELSRRIGGYSEEWLTHVIDGREEVSAHGSREMPVWGVGFYDPGRPGDQEAEIEGRIRDLVEYVLSIQEAR